MELQIEGLNWTCVLQAAIQPGVPAAGPGGIILPVGEAPRFLMPLHIYQAPSLAFRQDVSNPEHLEKGD
jgi:hypothetical protein